MEAYQAIEVPYTGCTDLRKLLLTPQVMWPMRSSCTCEPVDSYRPSHTECNPS